MNLMKNLKDLADNYAKSYDAVFIKNYLLEEDSSQVQRLIHQADLIMEQTFVFEDNWDMEPCHEPYTFAEMVWGYSPNGDQEWIYMLNRHDYLHKLLLAYWFTGDTEYISKLKWYLFHWLRNYSAESEILRTIDTGIRCMNWQLILLHLVAEDLLDILELEELLSGLKVQYIYLKENYIGKYTLSNWGILQTTAICQGYLWFDDFLPFDGLKKWAWQELRQQLTLQIMDDGSHWEQSVMYHNEVLLACMKLLASCRARLVIYASGKMTEDSYEAGWGELEESVKWLSEYVEQMSLYVLYAAGPDHMQIAQCDSDVSDVRDIMVMAAALTTNSNCRFGGYDFADCSSAWLLGRTGIKRYKGILPAEPDTLSLHAVDTGNIYFRSSWEESGHYTYLTCGQLGSGHGHADLTHISLYYQGRPFLVDSGRYSYREDEVLRPYLKSEKAHNVCIIDGQSQGKPEGSWSYSGYGESLKTYYCEKQPVHYAEMAWHGVLKDNSRCLVIRKVIFLHAGIWLIVNDICCDGYHQSEEYYHLDPDVRVKRYIQPASWLSENISPKYQLSSGISRLNLWGSDLFTEKKTIVSKTYNQKDDTLNLVKRCDFKDRLTNWTCLGGSEIHMRDAEVFRYGDMEPLSDELVTAKEFIISDKESWVLIIWHRENYCGGKLFYCKGIPLYAKAAVIRRYEEKTEVFRLRN